MVHTGLRIRIHAAFGLFLRVFIFLFSPTYLQARLVSRAYALHLLLLPIFLSHSRI